MSNIKSIVTGIAISMLMATTAAVAQTQQNAPGTGGTSKPGMEASPGTESGAATTPSHAQPAPPVAPETSGSSTSQGSKVSPVPAPDASTMQGQQRGAATGGSMSGQSSQDESKVPGLPGGKSGPSHK
jgi:hypothetical protein